MASYYRWAYQNLRIGQPVGFEPTNVFVPRGCFYFDDQIVSSTRLDSILRAHPDQWEARTEPGEDGIPPEIRIKQNGAHPLLQQIRDALENYEVLVQQYSERLQILGIGIGGAIESNPQAGGHIGFVECGAAAEDSTTMLVRLAASTLKANASDFAFRDEDGQPITFEPARFAITQGIRSVLSAGAIMLLAWGKKKQAAVERLLLGTPGPQNPAAWLQTHDDVTVFVDADAFGTLDPAALKRRGWKVEIPG